MPLGQLLCTTLTIDQLLECQNGSQAADRKRSIHVWAHYESLEVNSDNSDILLWINVWIYVLIQGWCLNFCPPPKMYFADKFRENFGNKFRDDLWIYLWNDVRSGTYEINSDMNSEIISEFLSEVESCLKCLNWHHHLPAKPRQTDTNWFLKWEM